MKTYHLTESEHHGAAIIFGRFNPPHFGHSNAWTVASKFPIWYVGTNQSTQGPKDPLPFEVKVEAMKTIMPGIEDHLVAEQSWWTLATMVYKQHGGAMVLHVVTDPTDKDIFVPGLLKSNGVEGVHGFYQFQDIVWAPATRDSTATALRAAVEHNNPEAFSRAAGIPADTLIGGKPFFDLVRHYMTPYLHAGAEKERIKAEKERIKAEKEKQKAEKAAMKQQPKTNGPAQQLAEMAISMTRDPNDPDIYGHEKANPMSLKGRIMQARAQLKELASMADSNDLVVWENLCKKAKGGMFMGLEQNLEQIRHGIAELAHARRTGKGVDPRARKHIDKNIGDGGIGQALEEIYEAKARPKRNKYGV